MTAPSVTTDSGAAFERAFELHREGKLAQALAAYEALLQRWPGHAHALHYSGVLLYQAGRLDEAVARIESSLKSVPGSAEARCNLALVYQAQGRLQQAVAALVEALRYESGQPQIWNNLAGVLLASGRGKEAETAVRRALQIDAASPASQFNLALCFEAQGRFDEALRQTEAMLRAFPEAIAPAGLKAQIEQSLGRLDAARTTLATALTRNGERPDAAPLYFQRASVEQQQGKLLEASSSLERVLQLDSAAPGALSELLFLRKQLADWHDLGDLRARFRAGVAANRGQLSPFCLLSDPSSRAEQRLCAQRWSSAYPTVPRPRRMPSKGILRIGYLSADFRQHATGVLAAGLFENHDRQRFSVFGYSTGADDGSAMRARLMAGFDRFVDARDWTTSQLAAQIAADGVDLLIDLKGHTQGAPTHAVALRAAPIQVNYLGYPGTMGAGFIDYLIGDPIVTPFAHAADYSETLVQLPASYQINDSKRTFLPAPPKSELGLPENVFVFCAFSQAYKLNPETFDAWAQILAAVPRSVMWLLGASDPTLSRVVEANLLRGAVARDIDPSRLVFASRRPHAEYVGLYRHADLFLDTWPYNAHTTASDALWVGCPVLTWLGDTFAGRVGASLLTAVGLPELIAPDLREYIARAIELAHEPGTLARHRQHLADAGRHSALFDTVATTRALEEAYLRMAEQTRSGARASFRVDSLRS
ncbi:MAG TPA: tetratricopeptide repeat protein [Casimicrobiaceae bacterium]|nr:tetratricopeptide repeat protein [Casimicrobiaceae bacterium]